MSPWDIAASLPIRLSPELEAKIAAALEIAWWAAAALIAVCVIVAVVQVSKR